MKMEGYSNHYTNLTPPKEGMLFHRGQLTKLHRNNGKLSLNCDHCGIPFEKYAAWAKRNNNHYCGRACASAARKVQISKSCVVCNTEMLLSPSSLNRISTCSKLCSRKRRIKVKDSPNPRSSPDYMSILKRLKKNTICSLCNTTNGPWVVRNIDTWTHEGLSYADGENAYLVCQHCHLNSVRGLVKNSIYMSNRFQYYKEKEKNT